MYLSLKALHIIAVISWMAGMLYLPRLFVYHADAATGSEQSETFKVMERRLYVFIMMPAMIVTWVLGIVLVFEGQWFASGWFIAKFVLVIALTIMHGLLGHWTTEFSHDRNRHQTKFFRIVNEIPTILMIAIVILAVVKPF
ncbi:MAG: protoporphyrinogen oxidase HemJ [Betaproteobacteria bacterium]|nr:protoporphyrinogen oxidase HemJ [Betaproteobacteria bacterium]